MGAVVDVKTIAPGSSDAAVEGRYYQRKIRIKKEIFCALVQFMVEELTNDFNDIDMELKSLFLKCKRMQKILI